jgi:2-dehydropantoate 2-reductase
MFMKIAVMGAGAVGCYYGGMLARAGHEVVLIGRQPHVDAIRTNGLLLEIGQTGSYIPVQASTEASALGGAELVLCCVKSSDTAEAACSMLPYLGTDTRVLSLQNGVDNAARLAEKLARPVAAAVVYVATEMAGPGHVRHHGRGDLVLSAGALTPEQQAAFVEAGIPLQLSTQVSTALWEKLIVNCAYNALSAITQMSYGPLWREREVPTLMRSVMNECLAVAAAENVCIVHDVWASIEGIAQAMPGQISSTAQDLARKRQSEIEHLNGYIVRKGVEHGIPTPANQSLYTLVRLLERRNMESFQAVVAR